MLYEVITFIFLSAMLAFLGIMLGVMVLIIAMALMNGFDNEFKKKLTIMNYPLTISPIFFGRVNEELLMTLRHVITSYSIHYTKLYEEDAQSDGLPAAPLSAVRP